MASVANAQATRTWVSGVGDDANPCSRTAPCKTFAGAISKTADKGEISVLDPGGYGAVTVTKNITINGEGQIAGVLNAGTNGIVVNGAGIVCYIHKISINGAGSGLDGVKVFAAGAVIIEDSWIYGQTGHGVEVTATAQSKLKLQNVTIENVTGDCMHLNTTAGQVITMVNESRLQDCANGFNAVANVRGGINKSVITHATIGVETTGNDSQVNLEDDFISYCQTAMKSNNAGTPSHIRVSDSSIAQNATGIDTSLGGTIDSFQGNSFPGTTTPGVFSSTTAKQ